MGKWSFFAKLSKKIMGRDPKKLGRELMGRPFVLFALIVHVFSSSIRAVCQLEHLRIQIYTIYTFYTVIKEGFATASSIIAVGDPLALEGLKRLMLFS